MQRLRISHAQAWNGRFGLLLINACQICLIPTDPELSTPRKRSSASQSFVGYAGERR